jgi:hypothetical protein
MKRRKTQRRRGGGEQERIILDTQLKNWLITLFNSHRAIENIVIPYKHSLFFHVKIFFDKDNNINELDLEISTNNSDRVFLHKSGCHLGVKLNTPQEKKQPWGAYVHPTVIEKGIYVPADYSFSLTCTPYQGTKYTNFLFLAFFYILKLHANITQHRDYIIAADDAAYSNGKALTDIIVEKVITSKMRLPQILQTPVLYYERFGFIYPEKKEFFTNLMNTGEAFIMERGDKSGISRYYIDLSTISIQNIVNAAHQLTTR